MHVFIIQTHTCKKRKKAIWEFELKLQLTKVGRWSFSIQILLMLTPKAMRAFCSKTFSSKIFFSKFILFKNFLFENILFENILLQFVFEECESVWISSKCNIGVISHIQSKLKTAKHNSHFLKKKFVFVTYLRLIFTFL